MSKRYTAKETKYLLDTILANALYHMYELEKQVDKIGLKMDGTDKPEDMSKARMFTMVLTILNDSVHSAHAYARNIFDARTIDRYIKNQKVAFDSKLVNPCSCLDCRSRGYDEKKEESNSEHKSDEMVMDGQDSQCSERSGDTCPSQSKD